MQENITTETASNEHILKKLNAIEQEVKKTQESMRKIKQFMFWRLIIVAFVVILPLLVLPFVIMNFIDIYASSFEGLL